MDNNLSCLKMTSYCTNTCHRGAHFAVISGWMAALIFLILIIFPTPAIAATIPEPPPALYVLDQAEVLSSQTESMIINTSQELARQTKAQVAVVTLKSSLDEQPIEDVALEIGRKWQLGDKQLNNGIVILLVPVDRTSRIEVGYGLEGALTDAKTGRIQDEFMLPAFKQGNYDLGLANGYKAVVTEVAKEYGATVNFSGGQTAPTEAPAQKKMPTWATILGAIGLMILIWIDSRFLNGFFLGMLLGMLFRGGGRGGGGFGGGSSGGGGSFGGGGSSRDW